MAYLYIIIIVVFVAGLVGVAMTADKDDIKIDD